MTDPPVWTLIADPSTGKVVRRAKGTEKNRPMLKAGEVGRGWLTLRVTKGIWKSYQAGDMVEAFSLPIESQMRAWLVARARFTDSDPDLLIIDDMEEGQP